MTIMMIVALIPIIGVVVFLGRYGLTDNSVQSAAFAAARDASMSRGTDAVPHAKEAAQLALGDNAHCASLDVTIGGNGLSTGLGRRDRHRDDHLPHQHRGPVRPVHPRLDDDHQDRLKPRRPLPRAVST